MCIRDSYALNGEKTALEAAAGYTLAVSYTHLDVYKRQLTVYS